MSNNNFWGKVSNLYDTFMKLSEDIYIDIIKNIKSDIPADKDILELACGTGQLSFDSSCNAKSYVATDYEDKMIEIANKKENNNKALIFKVEDAKNLSFKDKSFDVVIISNALHIIDEPEEVLKEIKRVLKDEGILIAPNFIYNNNFFFKIRMKAMELFGLKVCSKWTYSEYINFLEENGFINKKDVLIGKPISPLCYIELNKK